MSTPTEATPVVLPTTPPVPPAPAPAASSSAESKPVASNVDPGVNLVTKVKEDDAADVAKRDEAVEKLVAAYDDPEQQDRVRARFADKEDSA